MLTCSVTILKLNFTLHPKTRQSKARVNTLTLGLLGFWLKFIYIL